MKKKKKKLRPKYHTLRWILGMMVCQIDILSLVHMDNQITDCNFKQLEFYISCQIIKLSPKKLNETRLINITEE